LLIARTHVICWSFKNKYLQSKKITNSAIHFVSDYVFSIIPACILMRGYKKFYKNGSFLLTGFKVTLTKDFLYLKYRMTELISSSPKYLLKMTKVKKAVAEPGVVVQAYNPSTQEAEAGGMRV
jgi:hypothetical protein